MFRSKSQINKTSDLPNGVSRFIEYDYRLTNPKGRICYGVLVYEKGKRKVRKFRVSASLTEDFVRKTAIAFRKFYEHCSETNFDFRFDSFDGWRTFPDSLKALIEGVSK